MTSIVGVDFGGPRREDDQRRKIVAIAACRAAGISLEVEAAVAAFCCRYSSGGKTPDYDGADAFVALCTAILYREGECWRASGPDSTMDDDEGVIWVPKYDVREPR